MLLACDLVKESHTSSPFPSFFALFLPNLALEVGIAFKF